MINNYGYNTNSLATWKKLHYSVATPIRKKTGFKKFTVSTAIRWDDLAFIGSRSIQHTGQYLGEAPQPRAARIFVRSMQLVEFAILKIKPDIGEEIVLKAEK